MWKAAAGLETLDTLEARRRVSLAAKTVIFEVDLGLLTVIREARNINVGRLVSQERVSSTKSKQIARAYDRW